MSDSIQPGSFLTLRYRLSGGNGIELINTLNEKPATLSLSTGELAPALEECLFGLHEGDHQTFHLEAGQVFGHRNEQLLQRVKRSLLNDLGGEDEEYKVGDVVQFPAPDGNHHYSGLIREIKDDWLLFDFNHPLAGQPLTFEVQVIGVL